MSPTAAEIERFRRKVGDDGTVFNTTEINDIFAEAGETYTQSRLIMAQAVVLGVEALLVNSAKLVNYRVNQSSENQSDIFTHLNALHQKYTAEREKLVWTARAGAKVGTPRRMPQANVSLPKWSE